MAEMSSISAKRLAEIVRTRLGRLEALPPVDFISQYVAELATVCSAHLPSVDEETVQYGSALHPDGIEFCFARPSLGRGRDLGERYANYTAAV